MDDLPFLRRRCLGCVSFAFTSSLLLSNVRPVDTMVWSDVDEPGVVHVPVSFGQVALGLGRRGLARQQDRGLVFPPPTLCMLMVQTGQKKQVYAFKQAQRTESGRGSEE